MTQKNLISFMAVLRISHHEGRIQHSSHSTSTKTSASCSQPPGFPATDLTLAALLECQIPAQLITLLFFGGWKREAVKLLVGSYQEHSDQATVLVPIREGDALSAKWICQQLLKM